MLSGTLPGTGVGVRKSSLRCNVVTICLLGRETNINLRCQILLLLNPYSKIMQTLHMEDFGNHICSYSSVVSQATHIAETAVRLISALAIQ